MEKICQIADKFFRARTVFWLRAVGNGEGTRGALGVQMDFTWTFQANAKCNNINHV